MDFQPIGTDSRYGWVPNQLLNLTHRSQPFAYVPCVLGCTQFATMLTILCSNRPHRWTCVSPRTSFCITKFSGQWILDEADATSPRVTSGASRLTTSRHPLWNLSMISSLSVAAVPDSVWRCVWRNWARTVRG